MKAARVFLCILLAAAALFLISVDTSSVIKLDDKPLTPPPSSISVLYREAEKIVIAACMRRSYNESGKTISRFHIDEVLEGSAEDGENISVLTEAAAGQRYLLYINGTSESENEYTIITDQPVPVTDDGSISYDGSLFSIESLSADIERQKKILTVPSGFYYYDSLEALAPACDVITIGRVLSVSEPIETVCRSGMKGESTQSTLNVVYVTIKVENDLTGGLYYGDKIRIAFAPSSSIPIINSTDLNPMTSAAPPFITPITGSSYVFFLIKSEDKKRNDYFTINPYEGYILLIGNTMIRNYYNDAIKDITNLNTLILKLKLSEA